VPDGQIPCLLRNASDLLEQKDQDAFSNYENSNLEFKEQLRGSYQRYDIINAKGRSSAFCFKDEYNNIDGKSNQVHTRSLHAEENAFLQITKYGGEGIKGGNLYTTASPCELCAKKAYQLGIKNIYYIDPYPGISINHILQSGDKLKQPTITLFEGAVGRSYHKLYDPILPYKDELKVFLDNTNYPIKFEKSSSQKKKQTSLDL
jgi:dCMP deaminase